MNVRILTERLEIMPYRKQDHSNLSALLVDPRIKETFMIPEFQTEAALERCIQTLITASQSDRCFERGIFLKGKLIGFVNEVERLGGSIELGYVIHPSFWGCGYATEMLKAVIEWLLEDGFTEIITGAFEENTASIRVMQKCGMVQTEKIDTVFYHGKNHHCVYFSRKKKSEIM